MARGLRPVLRLTYARLSMDMLDADDVRGIVERPHAGYRLVAWEGTVPDDLAGSFAASRQAMDDMPMDETDVGVQVWDVDRVRAVARAVADRGGLLHTVAAIDEADGSVAGFTELDVSAGTMGDAEHYGTGVLPQHRGNGLGMWMKAAAILDVRDQHPGVTGLLTDTADSNTAMRAINERLGYVPTHHELLFQADL